MEEELEVQEEPVKKERKVYWNASEIFTILSEKDFTKKVMPFIKAYYKHIYGNELYLHDHDNLEEIYIVLHVDRVSSTLTFYNEEGNYETHTESELKNDMKDLTPENIFDFMYYEYKNLFEEDPCAAEPEKKKVNKKEIKITL